jgi:hypothetical protein
MQRKEMRESCLADTMGMDELSCIIYSMTSCGCRISMKWMMNL